MNAYKNLETHTVLYKPLKNIFFSVQNFLGLPCNKRTLCVYCFGEFFNVEY